MADYKTHVAVAGALGVGWGACAWWGLPGVFGPTALGLAVFAAWLGGMIPDLDHDTGTALVEVSALVSTVLPVWVVAGRADALEVWLSWGLVALLPAHYALHALLRAVAPGLGERTGFAAHLRGVLVAALCALGCVAWEGEGALEAQSMTWLLMVAGAALVHLSVLVFKRITVHRGVWHTVPAVVAYALVMVALAEPFPFPDRLLIGGAALLGGMSHLALDEIYAVDFDGALPRVKASFGSALSLWKERYPVASAGVYALVAGLLAWVLTRESPDAILAALGELP